MYEYAVVFTFCSEKYAILVEKANSSAEAIELAIVKAKTQNRQYQSVEAIFCI